MFPANILLIIWGASVLFALVLIALFGVGVVWLILNVTRHAPAPGQASRARRRPTRKPVESIPDDDTLEDDDSDHHVHLHWVNPANGLPIMPGTGGPNGLGGIDVQGNPWGSTSQDDFNAGQMSSLSGWDDD